MKIQPVAKNVPSPIPTAAEAAANPALIGPARAGRTRRGLGALVGAGLLGSLLAPIAGCSEREAAAPTAEPATAPAVPDPADAEAAARAEAAREAVATVVAPILQKALDEEGRGAFGCVAVDAPVVFTENDALDLIEQEFAKAGIKLRRDYEVSGFIRTIPDKENPDRENPKHQWLYAEKQVERSWTFDLATEDDSLAVEFLSLRDESQESFKKDVGLSVESFDLPNLAQRLRADFATRTNGTPITIGLFFDPVVYSTVWDKERHEHVPRPGSAFAALSDEEREAIRYDWGRKHELLYPDAREMLREQVQYFLDWARKEGKIPSDAPEPSADAPGGAAL